MLRNSNTDVEMELEEDELSQEYYNRVAGLSDQILGETVRNSNLSATELSLLNSQSLSDVSLSRLVGSQNASHSASERSYLNSSRIAFVLNLDENEPPQRILYSRTMLAISASHLDISPEIQDEESFSVDDDQEPFQNLSRLRRLINLRRDVLGWCEEDETNYLPSSRINPMRRNFRSRLDESDEPDMDSTMYHDESIQTLNITGTSIPYYPSLMASFDHGLSNLEAQNPSEVDESEGIPGTSRSILDLVASMTGNYPVAQTFQVLFAEEISKIEKSVLDANGEEIGVGAWAQVQLTDLSVMSSHTEYKKMVNDLDKFRLALEELKGAVPIGR
jgi:hypothetical protein